MRRSDFVAAYLQGELLDDGVVRLYCSMPSGYETGLDSSNPSGADTVLRIEKPIYGMVQAGRRWQRTILPYVPPSLRIQGHRVRPLRVYPTRDRPEPERPARRNPDHRLLRRRPVYPLHARRVDEHSIYHSFTKRLTADWKVEDEGPIAGKSRSDYSLLATGGGS